MRFISRLFSPSSESEFMVAFKPDNPPSQVWRSDWGEVRRSQAPPPAPAYEAHRSTVSGSLHHDCDYPAVGDPHTLKVIPEDIVVHPGQHNALNGSRKHVPSCTQPVVYALTEGGPQDEALRPAESLVVGDKSANDVKPAAGKSLAGMMAWPAGGQADGQAGLPCWASTPDDASRAMLVDTSRLEMKPHAIIGCQHSPGNISTQPCLLL